MSFALLRRALPGPLSALFRAAVALTLALGGVAGCGDVGSTHLVKSARARLAAPPPIPALNLSDGEETAYMALRVSHASPGRGRVSTDVDTAALHDTTRNVPDTYYAVPGNYAIERERLTVGLDFQTSINRAVDFFAAIEAAPTLEGHASALVGMGLTLPTPWLGLRFAPALDVHRSRLRVVDSTSEFVTPGEGVRVDGDLVTDDRHRLHLGMGASFSAWIPALRLGVPLTPFVQAQFHGLLLNSVTLPVHILSLQTEDFAAGLNYETPWGHVQARLSREAIGAEGWSRSWRAHAAVLYRLDER